MLFRSSVSQNLYVLGQSWGYLGLSWAISGHLGQFWGHIGTLFGPTWDYLGLLEAILGACWDQDSKIAPAGFSRAPVSPSWAILGPKIYILLIIFVPPKASTCKASKGLQL